MLLTAALLVAASACGLTSGSPMVDDVKPGSIGRGEPLEGAKLTVTSKSFTEQLILGAINVILLAPVWMQLVHLLVADLLWIAFVLLGATALAAEAPAVALRARPIPNGRFAPDLNLHS